MRTASAALANHLAGETTSIATCWKLTRTDGTVMGFTDYVTDLVVSGTTYVAATGATPTGVDLDPEGARFIQTEYGIPVVLAPFEQAELPAGVAIREAGVVQAQQVEDRGVEVVDVNFVFDGREAELVG